MPDLLLELICIVGDVFAIYVILYNSEMSNGIHRILTNNIIYFGLSQLFFIRRKAEM